MSRRVGRGLRGRGEGDAASSTHPRRRGLVDVLASRTRLAGMRKAQGLPSTQARHAGGSACTDATTEGWRSVQSMYALGERTLLALDVLHSDVFISIVSTIRRSSYLVLVTGLPPNHDLPTQHLLPNVALLHEASDRDVHSR